MRLSYKYLLRKQRTESKTVIQKPKRQIDKVTIGRTFGRNLVLVVHLSSINMFIKISPEFGEEEIFLIPIGVYVSVKHEFNVGFFQ